MQHAAGGVDSVQLAAAAGRVQYPIAKGKGDVKPIGFTLVEKQRRIFSFWRQTSDHVGEPADEDCIVAKGRRGGGPVWQHSRSPDNRPICFIEGVNVVVAGGNQQQRSQLGRR
jgi:hypothetical protein